MASTRKKIPVPGDETADSPTVAETTPVPGTTTSGTENTDDESAAAEGTAVKSTAAESRDDEMRRRYREALERKHSGGSGGNSPRNGPKPAALSSNDKTKRVFRRKSGG